VNITKIKDEVRRELEERLVKKEIEEEIRRELRKEGFDTQERVSNMGKSVLNVFGQKLQILIACAVVVAALVAWCVWASQPQDDGSESGERLSPTSPTQKCSYRTEGTDFSYESDIAISQPSAFESTTALLGAFVLSAILMCIGAALGLQKADHDAIFWVNLLAVIPESYLIGIATEQLALHIGDKAGAIVNASFGNAVEVIFVYWTLQDNLLDACAGSLVGSILSNHLLLLGFSFLVGGALISGKFELSRETRFDKSSALDQAQQLLVASFSMTMPAIFARLQHVTKEHVVTLSQAFSVFLLLSYVALVVHELPHGREPHLPSEATLSSWKACALLAVATGMTWVSSEFMVNSLDQFCESAGLSQTFVGFVILPIAGDLTHAGAVYLAMKGKMNLAINIAMASAIQVALVIVPISVFLGSYLHKPMTLAFDSVYGVTLIISAVITFAVIVDGKSNWLRGYALLTTFTFICLVIFLLPDDHHGT